MKKAHWALAALATVAVSFAVGVSAGWLAGVEAGYSRGRWDATEDARQKLDESGLLPPRGPIFKVSGKVLEVGDGRMIVEVDQTIGNPFEAPAPTKRVVLITGETMLLAAEPLTPAELDAAIAAHEQALRAFLDAADQAAAEPPAPPKEYREKKISLDEIAQGVTVTVESKQDLAWAEEFTATVVTVRLEAPAANPPPGSPPPTPGQ